MNIKRLLKYILIGFAAVLNLTACNNNSNQVVGGAPIPEPTPNPFPAPVPADDLLDEYKEEALKKLDEIVLLAGSKLNNETLWNLIYKYYNTRRVTISLIKDVEKAEEAKNNVKADFETYIKDVFRDYFFGEIDNIINPLIDEITDEDVKESVKKYYREKKIKEYSNLTADNIETLYNEIINDVKKYIADTQNK